MNGPFTAWALPVALGFFAAAMLLAAVRLLRGPGAIDRVLALDTLYVNALAVLLLAGLRAGQTINFEATLLIALLGFASTVALAGFLSRHASGDVPRDRA